MSILSNTKASFKRMTKSVYKLSYECAFVQEKVIHDKYKQFLDLVNYKYTYESRCCFEGSGINKSYIEPDFLLYDKFNKITLVEFKKRGVSLSDKRIREQVTKYAQRLYSHNYDMSGEAILTDGRMYHFYKIDANGFQSFIPYKSYDANNPNQLVNLVEEFMSFDTVTDEISEETIKMICESRVYLKKDGQCMTELTINGRKCHIKFNDQTFKVFKAYKLPRFRAQIVMEDDITFKKAQEILNTQFN